MKKPESVFAFWLFFVNIKIMTERISKTVQFLRETFDSSEYWKTRPTAKAYRYDHSMRVANYAKTIGLAEGMDVEALEVAALLHDVSYGLDFNIKNSLYYKKPCPELESFSFEELIMHHGYVSALHSMDFVNSLGFSPETTTDILYAIATHIQMPEVSVINGQDSVFVKTIRDADEIDHVGSFRFYEDLMKFNFTDKTQEERQQFVWSTKGITQSHMENMYLDLRTETAKKLYKQNCDYRFSVLENLQALIDNSKPEIL